MHSVNSPIKIGEPCGKNAYITPFTKITFTKITFKQILYTNWKEK